MNNEKTARPGQSPEVKPTVKDTTAVDTTARPGDRAPPTLTEPTLDYRVLNLQKARAKKRGRVEPIVDESPPKKKPRVETEELEESDEDDEQTNTDARVTIRRVDNATQSSAIPSQSVTGGSGLTNLARTLLSTTLFTIGAISVSISASFFKGALADRLGVKKPTNNQWML